MKLLDRCLIFLGLCALFMFGATWSTALNQQRGHYKNAEDLFVEIQNIYTKAQPKQFQLFTSTPNVRELDELNVVVVRSGGVRSIFIKESGNLYRVPLVQN